MAKCSKCGRKGLFVKVNSDGLCDECIAQAILTEVKEQIEQLEEKKQEVQEQIKRLESTKDEVQYQINQLEEEKQKVYDSIKAQAKKDADIELKKAYINGEEIVLQYHEYRNRLAKLQEAYNSEKLWTIKNIDSCSITHDSEYMDMNYKSIDVPVLRKLFKQTKKQMKECYEEYKDAYDSYKDRPEQAVFTMLKEMIDLRLEKALSSLKYGNMADIIAAFNSSLNEYQIYAITANEKLDKTASWFVGKMKALCTDAINIEYTYYTEQERIKEEQRAIKEQMRQEAEERKALEKERKRIEKEEQKYINEIDSLKQQLLSAGKDTLEKLQKRIAQLEQQLLVVENEKEQILTLENGKAGYVYVISNIGSFGENVFKIGMTRRLEPMERINELSNASVPFPFDVHSFIFSNDAVALEHNIHETLTNQRVNKINLRKEFFRISLDELEKMVEELCPTAEFHKTALAEQYRSSL